jgi:hypothetical protein
MFWDKGPDALFAFTQNHVCNLLCSYLELDDLEDFDVYQIAAQLKATAEVTVAERASTEMEIERHGLDDLQDSGVDSGAGLGSNV